MTLLQLVKPQQSPLNTTQLKFCNYLARIKIKSQSYCNFGDVHFSLLNLQSNKPLHLFRVHDMHLSTKQSFGLSP